MSGKSVRHLYSLNYTTVPPNIFNTYRQRNLDLTRHSTFTYYVFAPADISYTKTVTIDMFDF